MSDSKGGESVQKALELFKSKYAAFKDILSPLLNEDKRELESRLSKLELTKLHLLLAYVLSTLFHSE